METLLNLILEVFNLSIYNMIKYFEFENQIEKVETTLDQLNKINN